MPTDNPISQRKMFVIGTAILAGLFFLLLTLAPRSIDTQAVSNVQPALLAMAAEQPNAVVRIVVQKSSAEINIEELIPRLGGTVIQSLPVTNSVVAEISAEMAVTLAKIDGVHWVNLESNKVVES